MIRFFFFISLFAISVCGYAQPVPPVANGDSLEAYKQQSFAAAEPRFRASLYHIGIETQQLPQGYLVTAVLEDYPAFFAGINRGDIITEVDGNPFHPIDTFNESPKPSYTLTLRREELEIEKTLTPVFENLFDSYRSAIANSVQEFSAGNKVIGYIRLWALSRSSSDLIHYQALMENFDHCDGLIIDLRSAYGFLDSSHIDALVPNPIGADYFGKSVVIIIDSSTSEEAMTLVRRVINLDRFVVLGQTSTDGLEPEIEASYPFSQVSRSDPQFEAALNRLLGTI